MPAISDETRFLIWIVTGVFGVLSTILLAYNENYLNYYIRSKINKSRPGKKPTNQPTLLTKLLTFGAVILFIIGTAIASSAPASQHYQVLIPRYSIFLIPITILIPLFWLGFSFRTEKTIRTVADPINLRSKVYRYSGLIRRIAYISIGIVITVSSIVGGYSYHINSLRSEKVVVLVTNLDGPKATNYRVTDILVKELRKELKNYPEFLLVNVNQSISEQQGRDYAISLGEINQADVIIWGWYGATDTDTSLTIHIDLINQNKFRNYLINLDIENFSPIEDLNSFTLQQRTAISLSGYAKFMSSVAFYNSGFYDLALNRFYQAVDQPGWLLSINNPSEIIFFQGKLLYWTGIFYNSTETILGAIDSFTNVIEEDENNFDAYISRYNAFTWIGDYDKALIDLDTAARIKPGDAFVAYYRCELSSHLKRDNYQEEVDCYTGLINIKSLYKTLKVGAYLQRGYAYIGLKEYQYAENDLNHAIFLMPKQDELYLVRGQIYHYMGQYKQSLSNFSYVINKLPNFSYAYDLRGLLYADMGKYSEALSDFNEAIKFGEDYPEIIKSGYYTDRGKLFYLISNYDNSINDLSLAINLNPNKADAYEFRGNCYLAKKEYSKAYDDFTEVIKLNPSYVDGYMLRGLTSVFLDDTDNALIDHNRALEIAPERLEIYCSRALIFEIRNENGQAKSDYEQCLKFCATINNEICNVARSSYQKLIDNSK